MCLAISNNLLLLLYDAPKRIFSTNSRSSGQPKNDAKTLFSTLHPLSMVIFATATVLAFVLLRNSRLQLPLLYTAWSNAYSEIGPKVRCDVSRLLARKFTNRIHSRKPASLNHPIQIYLYIQVKVFKQQLTQSRRYFSHKHEEHTHAMRKLAPVPVLQHCAPRPGRSPHSPNSTPT